MATQLHLACLYLMTEVETQKVTFPTFFTASSILWLISAKSKFLRASCSPDKRCIYKLYLLINDGSSLLFLPWKAYISGCAAAILWPWSKKHKIEKPTCDEWQSGKIAKSFITQLSEQLWSHLQLDFLIINYYLSLWLWNSHMYISSLAQILGDYLASNRRGELVNENAYKRYLPYCIKLKHRLSSYYTSGSAQVCFC